jgi:hypothetical protein
MALRSRRRGFVGTESLEPRRLLSSSFPNINISKMLGNQAEGAIAVDRADPSKLFAVSNIDVGDGLMAATSTDGGATWSRKTIANDKDGLPAACCDPSAEFDSFGNLFLTYLNSSTDSVIVLRSTDAGQSFTLLKEYHGNVDQPTINVGPGGVYVDWDSASGISVAGATDTGLGTTGIFGDAQLVPKSNGGAFGDIAIGPAGQVMVTYEKVTGNTGKLYVDIDPDGVGPAPFGKPILASGTHVPDFDFIDSQPNRGIDAEVGLAFDRSGGAFNGRVYMVYTDQTPGTSNTDIFLRYSDTNGSVWSNPIRVNDDTTLNSQLLPRIALDNTTGQVAVGWYDARNDMGTGGAGDTDHIPNDDVEYYATLVTPLANGLSISPNLQISAGASNAESSTSGIDLGDYTGLDFYNGTIHPEWFDNSNSTGDNPDGTLKDLDAYTANVAASAFTASGVVSLGGRADPSGLVAALSFAGGANTGFVKHSKSYTITVQYSDAAGINLSSLDSSNILVTGPNGFSQNAQIVHVKSKARTSAMATYRVVNTAGNFTRAQAGTYTIQLEPDQVLDPQRDASAGGILGTFAVATAGTGSHFGGGGQRHHGDPDHR